jgi:mono/diheme cytochrome c family protein
MNWRRLLCCGMLLGLAAACAAAASTWVHNVPEAARRKTNPFADQKVAIAAGARLFADHCAQCHGSDALGRDGRPSLRGKDVQQATDGEIFWLLKNGNRRRGMPSWSSLPAPSRWQIIAYLKSLGERATDKSASRKKEKE